MTPTERDLHSLRHRQYKARSKEKRLIEQLEQLAESLGKELELIQKEHSK